jgi:hypothetical protein
MIPWWNDTFRGKSKYFRETDVRHKSQRLAWDRTHVSAVTGLRLTVRATVWIYVLYDILYIYLLQLGFRPMTVVGKLVKKGKRQLYTQKEKLYTKQYENTEYTK